MLNKKKKKNNTSKIQNRTMDNPNLAKIYKNHSILKEHIETNKANKDLELKRKNAIILLDNSFFSFYCFFLLYEILKLFFFFFLCFFPDFFWDKKPSEYNSHKREVDCKFINFFR